jgi:hypothetical protein
MKKNLGLLIALIGICIAGGAMVFTPTHALNAGDSNSGINASAALFFSALIVFGAGVVIYAGAIPTNSQKHAE